MQRLNAMKKIVLTGGGTAGHVTPNIAMLDRLRSEGYEVSYIGSKNGIEKKLIEDQGVPYYGISTGKLRRYFSWQNFTDPFRVIKGYFEAKKIIKEIDPDVCFSKGGFVSVPVVLAAKKRKVPTIVHESDMTPGLANRIAIKRAVKVCCNFPETIDSLPKGKGVLTGTPLRKELFTGSRETAFKMCGFTDVSRPVLLVFGGSTGAARLNEAVRKNLDELLEGYNVIHLCGKGKADASYNDRIGYKQIEYCDKEMKDMFAAASVVVSRAGANAICELKALHKPNILVPLGLDQSRGDQILNAQSFEKQGFSKVIADDKILDCDLRAEVDALYAEREKYIEAMSKDSENDAESIIVGLINEVAR